MIKSYRSKGLAELDRAGKTKLIDKRLWSRILKRLDALKASTEPNDMNFPGFNFHPLTGVPQRYSVHVNGPWCITFAWDGTSATNVDLEQYH